MSGEGHPDDLEKLQDLRKFMERPTESPEGPAGEEAEEVTQKLPRADDKPHPARAIAPPGGTHDGFTEPIPRPKGMKDADTPFFPSRDGDTEEIKPVPEISIEEDPVQDLTEIAKKVQEEVARRKKPKWPRRGRRGDPPQTGREPRKKS